MSAHSRFQNFKFAVSNLNSFIAESDDRDDLSCPALCLIGDGGNSTSHGVSRHIDDRGIDGDSISRGVGGLVDNRVYGDSVSGSVGSLERCIHTIDTSLSTWLQESRDSVTAFAKNIKEGDIIYWFRDCALTVKSLLLLARGVSRD